MANILVIDDEQPIRRLIRLTLGHEHRVGEAGDGEEALRMLVAERWDVAILDVSMPLLDGLSVCRAARAEPSLAHLGIIIVSANVRVEEALGAGADRHLPKPFRPLELLAAIDEVVANRRGG
jgi:CheY-like chemotaxis protein